MKVIRDRPDARWLPARHRFAIFRLLAYGIQRAKSTRPVMRNGVVLGIDRDQSALEHYAVAIVTAAVTTCFVFAFLERVFILPAAVVLTPFVAFVVLHLLIVWQMFGPRSWRERNNIDMNSFIAMLIITAVAVYFAGTTTWARYVAWLFLGVLILNAIAAVISRLLPEPHAEIENQDLRT